LFIPTTIDIIVTSNCDSLHYLFEVVSHGQQASGAYKPMRTLRSCDEIGGQETLKLELLRIIQYADRFSIFIQPFKVHQQLEHYQLYPSQHPNPNFSTTREAQH
jgi:hypothetical protein